MNTVQQRIRASCQHVFALAGEACRRVAARLEPAPDSTLSAEVKELLARNAVFRNCHTGKRCFVIGNGPSLATQDLTPLGNEITFAMSGFWKHPILESWQPTYYCISDRLFFDRSEPMKEFFRQLNQRIHGAAFFVPAHAAGQVHSDRILPPDRSYYVKFHDAARSVDLTSCILTPQSVSQLCIEIALYMGCSPIYLLGLDHDWLAHRGMHRNFYEGKTVDNHAQAHGDLAKMSYRIDMECQLKLWQRYETIHDLARDRKLIVENATNGGFLDVFPRARYEDVVGSR